MASSQQLAANGQVKPAQQRYQHVTVQPSWMMQCLSTHQDKCYHIMIMVLAGSLSRSTAIRASGVPVSPCLYTSRTALGALEHHTAFLPAVPEALVLLRMPSLLCYSPAWYLKHMRRCQDTSRSLLAMCLACMYCFATQTTVKCCS